MKDRSNEIKCHNCGGNHPANYKGCVIRKQLQQKLFPRLREKKKDEFTIGTDELPNKPIIKSLSPT